MNIFITGTGTGVGKTLFACALLEYAKRMEMQTAYFKPVETGCRNGPQDKALASKFADKTEVVYALKKALSPHLAARWEGIEIDLDTIKTRFQNLSANLVVVEGAGGLLVPINAKLTFADLALELELPTIIVASSYLGAINHSLMTLDVAEKKGINTLGLVLNHTKPKRELADRTNAEALKELIGEMFLGEIPFLGRKPNIERAGKIVRRILLTIN